MSGIGAFPAFTATRSTVTALRPAAWPTATTRSGAARPIASSSAAGAPENDTGSLATSIDAPGTARSAAASTASHEALPAIAPNGSNPVSSTRFISALPSRTPRRPPAARTGAS